MSNWPEEVIESCRKYLKAGLSHAQVAVELWLDHRFRATRNSVIGKANRMGMERPNKSKAAHTPRSRKRKPDSQRRVKRLVPASAHTSTLRIVETVEMEQIVSLLLPEDIPIEQRKQLVDLGKNDCRWPYGDPGKPDFFFCGGVGFPYCPYHASVAFKRVMLRRPYIPPQGQAA